MRVGAACILLLHGACSLVLDAGDNPCVEPCVVTPSGPTNEFPCLNATFRPATAVTIQMDGEVVTDDLRSPSFSAEFEALYFNIGSADIFRASPEDKTTFVAASAVTEVNVSYANDRHPTLSEDGSRLRFVSDRLGVDGPRELYESRRTDFGWTAPDLVIEGEYEELYPPVPLSGDEGLDEVWAYEEDDTSVDLLAYWEDPLSDELDPVNEQGQFQSPWVSRDSLVLFFGQDKSDGDLFFSRRSSTDESWGSPQPVLGIDRSDDSLSDPWLSPDLCTIFYTRKDESSGDFEIMRADRMP